MPTYDLRCTACGREWERFSTVAMRYTPCEACSGVVEQLFKHSVQAIPFVAYFDIALGKEITSHAERWTAMRAQHVDYREKMAPGELSARRDRIEQQRREQVR